MTEEHSLKAISTDEDLLRCLRLELQPHAPVPTASPKPTAEVDAMECEGVLAREITLEAVYQDEDLMRCLRLQLE